MICGLYIFEIIVMVIVLIVFYYCVFVILFFRKHVFHFQQTNTFYKVHGYNKLEASIFPHFTKRSIAVRKCPGGCPFFLLLSTIPHLNIGGKYHEYS